jgi:hypothetical protein
MVDSRRLIREVAIPYTEEDANKFIPTIYPESLPYILSSVVTNDGVVPNRAIKKFYISRDEQGSPLVYQGAYVYPYCGTNTMFSHVEVVFEDIPVPHESILKWCSLALKAGPTSRQSRANQLVVIVGNHLHYLWRVTSIEGEKALVPESRSLDITGLHLWRYKHTYNKDTEITNVHWVCGKVSIEAGDGAYGITTSRGTRPIEWDKYASIVSPSEPVQALYMTLLGENMI